MNNKVNKLNKEEQKVLSFFENLCWLLDSNSSINFQTAEKLLKEWRNSISNVDTNQLNSSELIGILPAILKDQEIFETNQQLVRFANEVLSLQITRWEKRSRNEIIGLIICEVEEANSDRISTIIKWSQQIQNHKTQICQLQKQASQNGSIFSWNDTLQKLVDQK